MIRTFRRGKKGIEYLSYSNMIRTKQNKTKQSNTKKAKEKVDLIISIL